MVVKKITDGEDSKTPRCDVGSGITAKGLTLIKTPKRATGLILCFLLSFLSGCALLGNSLEEQKGQPVPPTGPEGPHAAESVSAHEVLARAEVIPPEPPKPKQILSEELSGKANKTGRTYRVYGRTYRPLLTAKGFTEKGIASWYGPSCQGRNTSCGEVFDMYKLSAAHRLLPMHTKITVTNLENGKSITLPVNDRGPFIPGRVLDLSYAAAKRLALVDKGLARVLIRTEGPVNGQDAGDLTGEFFVHVGSFEAEKDARVLLEDMKSLGYRPSILKVVRADRYGEVFWRVEVGPFKSMVAADKAETRVSKDYPSAFVVAKE